MTQQKQYKKKIKVGSVLKSKTPGEPDYIKFSEDVSFSAGTTLSLVSKKSKLEQLDRLEKAGTIDEATAADRREKTEKFFPDFVRFEIMKSE